MQAMLWRSAELPGLAHSEREIANRDFLAVADAEYMSARARFVDQRGQRVDQLGHRPHDIANPRLKLRVGEPS
jgi:hypothetical protein